MEILLDLKDYDDLCTVFKRTAARAIVKRGDQYLLIYSKYGDYKFPGGGLKEGETLEETMIREVKEETGYHVMPDTIHYYGKVLERRKGEKGDILKMNSYYYFCGVEIDAGDRKLDEYEEEYDYQVVWMPLTDAIERNKMVTDFDTCPWVIRELKVMETLKNEKQ